MNLNPRTLRRRATSIVLAALCAVAIGRGDAFAYVWFPQAVPQTSSSPQTAAPIPNEQLDALVAPIALYPDPLLAQTLAASTYPLEIMQLQQWLGRHPGLTGKALADAVAKQPWDPSVQSMAVLPEVVKRLSDDIQWTTDLGDAFLAQESGVMDAVQRMRQKAEGTGSLKSTPQQVVESRVVENKSVIVIEPSAPETIYVPSYNPVVVYGPPVYPYPSIYYPPAGYYAAGAAISFGLGIATAAFWGNGGGWGWRPGWGHNDITINRNNAFVRNNSFYRNGNFNTWQHNSVHRGGVAYRGAAAGRYAGRAGAVGVSGARAGAVGTSGVRGAAGARAGAVSGARAGAVGGARAGAVGGARAGAAARGGAVGTSGRSFNGSRGSVSGSHGNRGSFSGGHRSGGGMHRGGGGGGRRGGGGGGRRR